MSKSSSGEALCTMAMVLVGSTVVASKIIGDHVEPFLATALRHALALPIFLGLMWARGERPARITARDAILLLVQAAAGSVGYTVLLIQGIRFAGPADAGIVTGTLPAVAALFAVVFLGETINRRLVLAILLAVAGLVAVSLAPDVRTTGPDRLTGIALVLAAVACEAVFILADKRLSRPIPALTQSTAMSVGGLLLAIVPALLARQAFPSAIDAPAFLAIAYYAWVPTVIAFLLWYAGSARTSGARASLCTAWLPMSALLFSSIFFHQPIRPAQWAGLACVLSATILAGLSRSAERGATRRLDASS